MRQRLRPARDARFGGQWGSLGAQPAPAPPAASQLASVEQGALCRATVALRSARSRQRRYPRRVGEEAALPFPSSPRFAPSS